MGIFVKFECDNCGEYECDCPMELRNKKREPLVFTPILYSKVEPYACEGDIICSPVGDSKEVLNEAYVVEITQDGEIMVTYLDGRNNGEVSRWNGPHTKISNAVAESEGQKIAKQLIDEINSTDWNLPDYYKHLEPKASLVDILKPHQLLFNRRMAGETLTAQENAILDGGFPVQQARNEFIKELERVTELSATNLIADGWEQTFERVFNKKENGFHYFLCMGRYDKEKGVRDNSTHIDVTKIKSSDLRDGPTQGRFEGTCNDINFFRQIVKAI